MTERRVIDVDLTDRADGKVPVWDSASNTHVYENPTAGATPQTARYHRTAGNYTTSSTSRVDVDGTNLSLTITTGARKVMVGLVATGAVNNAAGTMILDLNVDGSDVGGTFGLITVHQHATANELANLSFTWLTDTLTAASHTFKLRFATGNGAHVFTLNGDTNTPLTFWVAEIA